MITVRAEVYSVSNASTVTLVTKMMRAVRMSVTLVSSVPEVRLPALTLSTTVTTLAMFTINVLVADRAASCIQNMKEYGMVKNDSPPSQTVLRGQ